MRAKATSTQLDHFKRVAHRWLVIHDDSYLDVVFGVCFANRLDTSPVWLYLVGPPGGGKTVIVDALAKCPEVCSVSTLTSHSLVSGKVRGKHEKDPSLLLELDGRTLVIKDFTTILSKRSDELKDIMGQLRDAYDGSTRHKFGTEVGRTYEAKFGLIACVTSDIDRHQLQLASLGERFLTYRLPQISSTEQQARVLRAATSGSFDQQRQQLSLAAQRVLRAEPVIATVSNKAVAVICELAVCLAASRTRVPRNYYSSVHEIVDIPETEVATRLTKQLVALGQGIAMARARRQVGPKELELLRAVAFGGLPRYRQQLLQQLAEAPAMRSELQQSLKVSLRTINLWLEDLELLGIIHGNSNKFRLDPKYKVLCQPSRKRGGK